VYVGGRAEARVRKWSRFDLAIGLTGWNRKNNRENLEQLPKLIQKLTEEVNELKSSNLALIENIRFNGGTSSLDAMSESFSVVPDSHKVSRAGSVAYNGWGM
jgi:3-phosphoglycerate kinase